MKEKKINSIQNKLFLKFHLITKLKLFNILKN